MSWPGGRRPTKSGSLARCLPRRHHRSLPRLDRLQVDLVEATSCGLPTPRVLQGLLELHTVSLARPSRTLARSGTRTAPPHCGRLRSCRAGRLISNDVKQAVQNLAGLNGDSEFSLSQDLKDNGILDVPVRRWHQARRSPGHCWFLFAPVEVGGEAQLRYIARQDAGNDCYHQSSWRGGSTGRRSVAPRARCDGGACWRCWWPWQTGPLLSAPLPHGWRGRPLPYCISSPTPCASRSSWGQEGRGVGRLPIPPPSPPPAPTATSGRAILGRRQ